MELQLKVLSSVSVKRKKPWPRFTWLGEPHSSFGLYLLDNHRISQLYLSTGKTKKRLPSLAEVQPRLALTCSSRNGAYLAGLTTSGQLFVWHQPTEVLEIFQTPLSSPQEATEEEKGGHSSQAFQGLKLFISDSGEQALLVVNRAQIYLWELSEGSGTPQWWRITPPKGVLLPQNCNKEASIDACFHVHPVLGECCSCVFVFTSQETHETVITHLQLNWHGPLAKFYRDHSTITLQNGTVNMGKERGTITPVLMSYLDDPIRQENSPRVALTLHKTNNETSSGNLHSSNLPLRDRTNDPLQPTTQTALPTSQLEFGTKQLPATVKNASPLTSVHDAPFSASWKTISYCSQDHNKSGSKSSLSGQGCYLSKFSPAGNVVALAINHKEALDTQVLFMSPLVETGLSSAVYQPKFGRKLGRTYWIADMMWTADGLLLACMTKRGSLMILPRFGQPMQLVTQGCSLDMGPSYSLPLHPLITVVGAGHGVTSHETSQSSERDVLRQRFSVSTHPHLPMVLCSDGYSITVFRLTNDFSLPQLVSRLAAASQNSLGLPISETRKEPDGAEDPSMKGPDAGVSHFQPTSKDENQPTGSEDIHPHSTGVLQHSYRHQPHSLTLQDFGSLVQGSDMDSTLATSLASTGLGFLMGLSGLEAGAIHFAGVDSDLEQSHTSMLGKTMLLQQEAEKATSQLNAAWGLLMSADFLEPGNGMYPQSEPLESLEIRTKKSNLQDAAGLVITLFSSLVTAQLQTKGLSLPENHQPLFAVLEFVSTALNLTSLDSNQDHLNWVLALSSVILFALLASCLEVHNHFGSIKETEHTLQLLRDFASHVTANVSTIVAFLNEILLRLANVYSLEPVSTSSLFATFYFTLEKFTCSDSIRFQLAVPLRSFSQVIEILWEDIRTCSNIAAKILTHRLKPGRLHLRELSLLRNSLVSSVKEAVDVLQSAHTKVTSMLQSNSPSLHAEFPPNGTADDKTAKKTSPPVHSSNPITSELRQGDTTLSPTSDSVSNSLSTLFKMLEQYNLKGALEFAHSFIANSQENAEESDVKSPVLVPRSSSDSAVTAPGSKSCRLRKTRSKSWAATHQHLLPVVQNPTLVSSHELKSTWLHLLSEGNAIRVFIQSDLGLAIVTSLARVMAAFFSNQPLVIAPPSNPFIIPPPTAIHSSSTNNLRYLELDQSAITRVIREQELSDQFTADHALELLLLCELWDESCEFISSLGDWRKGFVLASVYMHQCKKMNEICSSEAQVNLAKLVALEEFISQQAIENILQLLSSFQLTDGPPSTTHKGPLVRQQSTVSRRTIGPQKMSSSSNKSLKLKSSTKASCIECTQPYKQEILRSISSTFQACAFADLDSVLISTTAILLHELVECCKQLPILVPSAVYLPAPPLYCPQPGISHEVYVQCPQEYTLRSRIAAIIQDLLLVLKASHCLQPSAQWYTNQLQGIVHTASHESKLKLFRMPFEEDTQLSPSLVDWTHRLSFQEMAIDSGEKELPASVQFLLAAFRQLCCLLWLLHTRDQVSSKERHLHPSALKLHRDPTDPSVAKEAALWGARLLPFSELLSQKTEIQDIVLSLISELPSSTFVADLLALCFPGPSVENDGYLDAKMKRLLLRLRSTVDPQSQLTMNDGANQAEPLSIRYQTRSQMLLNAKESPDINIGDFQTIQLATSTDGSGQESVPPYERALQVGSFLFEHDAAYLRFLDTLFSVVIDHTEQPSKIEMQHSSRVPQASYHGSVGPPVSLPYLGSYLSKVAATTEIGVSCWEQVLPLLTALNSWSQTSTTTMTLSQKSRTMAASNNKTSEPEIGSQRRISRSHSHELQTPALRVNISVPFILNCLRNREDEVIKSTMKTGKHCSSELEAAQVSHRDKSAHPSSTRRKSSTAAPDGDVSRSLCLADLDASMHTPPLTSQHHVPESSPQTPSKQLTLATSGEKIHELRPSKFGVEAEEKDGQFPALVLLQVPQGILQGQLPMEVIPSFTGIEDVQTEERKPTTVHPQSLKPQQSNGTDVSSHKVESPSTVDLELTESASTGEVPSPITFSMGEFGSRKKPDETFLTTCTEFDGTLGQPSVLLQDASCSHRENLQEEECHAAKDGGGGGSPAGGARGSDEENADSPQDDHNGSGKGREEEEGGENREEDERGDGGGSDSEHLRAGGDGGGGSDRGQSSSSEKDLTSLSSSSNLTDISTEHLEVGHSPSKRESPTQELRSSEANEVHRFGGERAFTEQQPGSSPQVAIGLQPAAHLTDSEPPFVSPSFAPSVRNRHISGATTTITTDFSDGQSTQGPVTAKAHTLGPSQATVGGLMQGPPVVAESSVTTGSTEKKMRNLGYRNKAGPLQSTATKNKPPSTSGGDPIKILQASPYSSSGDGVADSETPGVQKREDLTGGENLVCHKEVGGHCQIGMDEEGEDILQGGRGWFEEKRPPPPSQGVPPDTIGRIVKSEMKKILKLQHEHLLELLDSTATTSLPQTVTEEKEEDVEEGGGEAQMEELQSTHHHHSTTPVILQAEAVADIQTEAEDTMAPLLNLEDLHSASSSEHPTHVTIPITLTQSQLNPEAPAEQSTTTTEQQTKRSSESTPRGFETKSSGSDVHVKDLSLSDLASGVQSISPTVSKKVHGQPVAAANRSKQTKEVMPFQMKSCFSKVKQTGRYGDMPLLHLDMAPADSRDPAAQRRDNLGFQHEYPHLAQALKQFDTLVAPVRHPVPHTSSLAGEGQTDRLCTQTTIPLLTIPGLHNASSAAHGGHLVPPKTVPGPQPAQTFPSHQNQPLPLLHLPAEGDTLPGMVPLPPHHLKQGMPQQEEPNKPFPLLTLPPQCPPPSQPHSLHTLPPLPPNFTLPQVPIRPFFASLIPPHLLQKQQQNSLPLLRLDDPLTKMKKEGLKLLQLPETKIDDPPKLLQFQEDYPAYKQPFFHPYPVISNPRLEKRVESAQSVAPTVADAHPTSEGPTAVATQESKPRVQRRKARRKHEKERHVSWKKKQEEERPEEDCTQHKETEVSPTLSDHARTAEELPAAVVADTLQQTKQEEIHEEFNQQQHEEEWWRTSEPSEHKLGVSHLKAASPERLEVRRLQMKSSYLNSSSSSSSSSSESGERIEERTRPQPVDRSLLEDVDGLQQRDGVSSVAQTIDKSVQVEFELTEAEPKHKAEFVNHFTQVNYLQQTALSSTKCPEALCVSQVQEEAAGHQFISVVDIEADSDSSSMSSPVPSPMPSPVPSPSPPSKIATEGKASPPVTAARQQYTKTQPKDSSDEQFLSHIATSAEQARSVPPSLHLQKDSKTTDALLPPAFPCTSLDTDEPSGSTPVLQDGEDIKLLTTDKLTEELLGVSIQLPEVQRFQPALGSQPLSSKPNMRSDVLERLLLLEEQLSAIESTARAVEGEFKSSNQLLHTLDQLQTVSEAQPSIPHSPKLDEEMAAFATDNVLVVSSPTRSTSDSAGKGTKMTGPSVPPSLASSISAIIVQDPPMHDEKLETTEVQGHHDIPVVEREPEMGCRKAECVTEEVVPKLSVSQRQKQTMDAAVSQKRVTDSQLPPLPVGILSKEKQKGHVQFQGWPQEVQESKVNRKAVSQRFRHLFPDVGTRPPQRATPFSSSFSSSNREGVKEWVVAKRKERLVEFAAQKENPQRTEKQPSQRVKSDLTKLRAERRQQKKREQEKEFLARRIEDAFSLMNDILSSKPETPKSSKPATNASIRRLAVAKPSGEQLSKSRHTSVNLPPRGGGSTRDAKVGLSNVRKSFDQRRQHTDENKGLSETYTKEPSTDKVFGWRKKSLRETCTLSTHSGSGKIRKISSIEGLTENEQDRMAHILASTEYDQRSLASPGSIASSIDWEEVDKILDS